MLTNAQAFISVILTNRYLLLSVQWKSSLSRMMSVKIIQYKRQIIYTKWYINIFVYYICVRVSVCNTYYVCSMLTVHCSLCWPVFDVFRLTVRLHLISQEALYILLWAIIFFYFRFRHILSDFSYVILENKLSKCLYISERKCLAFVFVCNVN